MMESAKSSKEEDGSDEERISGGEDSPLIPTAGDLSAVVDRQTAQIVIRIQEVRSLSPPFPPHACEPPPFSPSCFKKTSENTPPTRSTGGVAHDKSKNLTIVYTKYLAMSIHK